MSRTLEQKNNADGMVKPGELIEIRQSSALTLHDRRVLNLLIENAGPAIAADRDHVIAMWRLRGPHHRGGERVRDSVLRLMDTRVEVPTRDTKGNRATKHMHLLSDTTTTDDEDNPTGEVIYSFSPGIRDILKDSAYWGRIKAYVMFAFTSKYSLALYEMLCLRAKLHKDWQDFTFDDIRERLGVPDGKLDRAPDFLRRVINPAVEEVNALSDFNVEVELLRDGGLQRGKLRGFRVRWAQKEPEAWMKTLNELNRPKIGRRARIQGKVEEVA